MSNATQANPSYRLHPFSLVNRLIVSLPALVILLLPSLRSPDTSTLLSLLIISTYGMIILPIILMQYFRFKYTITANEIIIESGVLTRKHRSIPIERIHNIEIEQRLVPRMFGTAKVKIETAGSAKTEGVLEYVSIKEAKRIRQVLRSRQGQVSSSQLPDAEPLNKRPSQDSISKENSRQKQKNQVYGELSKGETRVVFSMPLSHVLLSGIFRFSLLYIVLIFTATEYLGINPEDMILWISQHSLEPLTGFIETSPWTAAAASALVIGLLAWITGIAVNLNRFYRFRLSVDRDKLHKKHGLLTLSEGTIPLKKVQALILRTNPLMRAFGWYRLEIQTMGVDEKTKGHQVVIPFARLETVIRLAQLIRTFYLPAHFNRVSTLTIRRAFIRYSFLLIISILVVSFFWKSAFWLFLVLPAVYYYSYLRFRNLGYVIEDQYLFVRRGVLKNVTWIIPTDRFQVFYVTGSLFQRRLHLRSLLVDTGGADPFRYPVIVDIPADEAERQIDTLYNYFQADHSNASGDQDSR